MRQPRQSAVIPETTQGADHYDVPIGEPFTGTAGFTVAVSHRSKHNGEWKDVNDVRLQWSGNNAFLLGLLLALDRLQQELGDVLRGSLLTPEFE